jgi:hypothetical protein
LDLQNKNPLPRIFALGKINRVIQKFVKTKLDNFDKRLLKGFYINDVNELENDSDKESRRFETMINRED